MKLEKGANIAPRLAFGQALCHYFADFPELVVLDADVGASTQTALFRDAHRQHFYQMGIAEANMVGSAAGLSTLGFIPFVSTFAIFLSKRAGEQVRNSVAYPQANVKLNGSYGGLPTGRAGASHSAIEDLAVMRAMPNMKIFVPADARETWLGVKLALETPGPVYLRSVRCEVPTIFDAEHQVAWGVSSVLHQGGDAVIISTGMMSPKALAAAQKLQAERGIAVKVIHIPSLKPLDEKTIVAAAREFGTIITVENHSIIGGLGSAVAEVLCEQAPCRLHRLGFGDIFLESGNDEHLFRKYGMNVENIAQKVIEVLEKNTP